MKNYLVVALGTMLLFSCSKEALPEQVETAVQEEKEVEKELTSVAMKAKGTITGQYGIYKDPQYPCAFVQNNIWSIDHGNQGADPGQNIYGITVSAAGGGESLYDPGQV